MSRWDQPVGKEKEAALERARREKRKKSRKNRENDDRIRQHREDNEELQNSDSLLGRQITNLRWSSIPIQRCRSIKCFEIINRVEEGTYGIVYRAKEIASQEIVALKKFKSLETSYGFGVTSLREIIALKELSSHPNIVNVREIIVGDTPADVYVVMDFIEHDLKALLEEMPEPFLQSEVKTLMLQIVSGTKAIHDKWLIHRDLKTSNLLMTNRGMVKIADFGLARKLDIDNDFDSSTSTSPSSSSLTGSVVTLWYRAPELLLGSNNYGPAIDMWAIGCIFAELLGKVPFLQGKSQPDQLSKIFAKVGLPSEEYWSQCKRSLPGSRTIRLPTEPVPSLASQFPQVSHEGIDLLRGLLEFDPSKRISCEEVLSHDYFKHDPLPKSPEMFPSFPSKGGLERRLKVKSPTADDAKKRWND